MSIISLIFRPVISLFKWYDSHEDEDFEWAGGREIYTEALVCLPDEEA